MRHFEYFSNTVAKGYGNGDAKKLLIFFRFVNFEMLFIFKIRFCLEKRYVFIIRLIPLLCHTNVTDFRGYIR